MPYTVAAGEEDLKPMAPKGTLRLQKPGFLTCWAACFSKKIWRAALYGKEQTDIRQFLQPNDMQKEIIFEHLSREQLSTETKYF